MDSQQKPENIEEIVGKQGIKSSGKRYIPQRITAVVESLEERVHSMFPGFTKEHAKGLEILAGSLVAVFMLRNELPQYTDYFNQKLPWLSDDNIVLGLDIVSNTLTAPVGFVIASYANGKKINLKELLGQIAFATGWGAIRHQAYIHGFNQFDYPITFENVWKKTLWFMPYTWFYAYLYTAYSAVLARWANGHSLPDFKNYRDALKGIFSFDLIKDGLLWTNVGLHLSNLYLNPAPNSKGVVGGLLVALYNSRVLRYSHGHKQGFLDYVRSIFKADTNTV